MPTVQFTSNLKRFYPQLKKLDLRSDTIAELLILIDKNYPGIKSYMTDDQGALRHHVNIFINNNMIKDRTSLSDRIDENDSVFIMQALSGG